MATGTPLKVKNKKVITDGATDNTHFSNNDSNIAELLSESYKALQKQK